MLQSENEFREFDMDMYLERDISQKSLIVLAKIGTEWNAIVGSSGSYVNTSTIINALNEEKPWSANKITGRRQGGANGVKYSFIPLLLKYNLAEVVNGKNFTRYQLTTTGREVLVSMIINCSSCDNTRTCLQCGGTGKYKSWHNNDNDRFIWCRSGEYIVDEQTYTKPTKEHIESCNMCDSDGHQICYSCHGNKKCTQCETAMEFLKL